MNKVKVDGMHCQNCVKAVKEAVSALPGAKGVEVSLEKGEVTWEAMGVGADKVDKVIEAIEDIGFDAQECKCCCSK